MNQNKNVNNTKHSEKSKVFNRNSIFWGIFFVTFGFMLLLFQFEKFEIDTSLFLKLWPLFFVFLGLSFLNIPNILKNIFAGISGFLVAMLIISLFNCNWNIFRFGNLDVVIDDDYCKYNYLASDRSSIELDSSIRDAALSIDAGAMMMVIGGGSEKLIDFDKRIDIGSVDMNYSKLNDKSKIEIDLSLDGVKNLQLNNESRRLSKIKLNNQVVWDLLLDIGASSLECDLSNNKIANLDLNVGAANVNIKLGEPDKNTNVTIDAGAASIHILVPDNVDCNISTDGFLTGNDFEGFTDKGNSYFAKGKSSNKLIDIHFSGAIGDLSVKRYSISVDDANINNLNSPKDSIISNSGFNEKSNKKFKK